MDKTAAIRPPVDIDTNPDAGHDTDARAQAEHGAHHALQRFIGHGATVKDIEALIVKQLELAGLPGATVKIAA